MDLRRLAIFLGLNAVVSAVVTLTVLWVWDATHRQSPAAPIASTSLPGQPLASTAGAETSSNGGSVTGDGATDVAGGGTTTAGLATLTPTVYIVQPGDTLGKVAAEFDVSVEALMAANGLTDPDVLDVGQTLIIPASESAAPAAADSSAATPGAPAATDTPLPAPTPLPTTTRAPSGAGPQLVIRGILGAGDVTQERVTIVNVGGDVSLAGWILYDEQGNMFRFPALSLFQGGAVNVHTRTGANTVTDLFWNQTAPIWQSGETAQLVDPTGTVHAVFVVP